MFVLPAFMQITAGAADAGWDQHLTCDQLMSSDDCMLVQVALML